MGVASLLSPSADNVVGIDDREADQVLTALSTDTSGGYRLRAGVVGLLAASLPSLACLSSVVGSTVIPFVTGSQFLHYLLL